MNVKSALKDIISCSLLHYYLIAVVLIALQIAFFAYAIDGTNPFFKTYQVVIFRLADAVVLMLPTLLLPRRFQWLQLALLWLITIWELANVWYYRAYLDLLPIYSLTMVDNATLLLAKSIIQSIHASDLLILLSVVAISCIYRYIFRHRITNSHLSIGGRIFLIACTILLFLCAQIIYTIPKYWGIMGRRYHEVVTGLTIERLTSYDDYYRKASFADSGLITYLYHFLSQWNSNRILSDSDIDEINQLFRQSIQNDNIEVANRNLILIIVESLESWVIDYSIEGKKVCPNLSSLCQSDSTIVARNIVTQTLDGMSSDAHLMYNTGLLPISSGATANQYGSTPFPSLCKAKAEYSALSIVCDQARFWNQAETFHNYGYNRLLDADSLLAYADTEQLGFDKVLFSFADSILQQTPQPFIAQLITLSMHSPYFDIPKRYRSWVSDSTSLPRDERNYLALTHYFDTYLGEFIDNLKKSGLYDTSIIAIISDHHRPIKEAKNQFIPMIILNTDTTLCYDSVIGQIDVYPTLLDIVNANNYEWRGLGFSILGVDTPASAVTSKGEIFGDTTSNLIPYQQRAWPLSNKIITGRYFKMKP